MALLNGRSMIFLGYEDGFEGELIVGEHVVVYDAEDEDVCYVHPVRSGRIAGHISEQLFSSEAKARPDVALLG